MMFFLHRILVIVCLLRGGVPLPLGALKRLCRLNVAFPLPYITVLLERKMPTKTKYDAPPAF